MATQRKNGSPQGERGEPDVILDVPSLKVEEITLEVDNLHARIALEARLADLIQIHVGADATVERVALEIKGVEAQAQLKARLDNVQAIMERALETIDQHPELLGQLAQAAGNGAGDAAGLLGEGAPALGTRSRGGGDEDGESRSSGRRRRSRRGSQGNGSDSGDAESGSEEREKEGAGRS